MLKKILVGVMALSLVASSVFATVTGSSITRTTWGNKRVTMGTLTIALASPNASGIAVTAKNVGLTSIDELIILQNASYLEYDWTFTKSGSGGYLVPIRRGWLDNEQVVVNTVQDSFACSSVVTMATDADTTVMLISPTVGNLARFVSGGCNATTAATYNDAQFTNAGATLYGNMADTVDTGVLLRARWLHADTVFFDYNADVGSRLAYCGTSLGNMGDLYVPWYDGKMIKVKYMTGAQMYAAGIGGSTGYMMYCKNGTNPAKFVWKDAAGATITNGFHATIPNVATASFTAVVKFIAIGK